MGELKPCPFCGGEAKTVTDYYFWNTRCANCGATGWQCCTEAEAIEAWNTRHERTCRSVDYVDPGYWFVCSECDFGRGDLLHIPNFCPNCGARVKEEPDAD